MSEEIYQKEQQERIRMIKAICEKDPFYLTVNFEKYSFEQVKNLHEILIPRSDGK